MLDPTIVVAIVNSSGKLLATLLKVVGKAHAPSDQAKKVISNSYDKIAPEVTTNSIRILIALDRVGSNQMPQQVSSLVKPMIDRQEPNGKQLENDVTYRLKFLCLLGLLQPIGGSEFALTDLGSAFIAKARDDQQRYSLAFIT